MNIKFIFLNKLCLFGLVLILNHHSFAGTVKIEGKIMSNICTLTIPSNVINLKKISAKELKLRSGGKLEPFIIKLINCGAAASGVALEFQGDQDDNNANLLKIETNSESAKGVAIAIYDEHKQLLPLYSLSSAFRLSSNDTDIHLSLSARYEANGEAIRSGKANANATLMLYYN